MFKKIFGHTIFVQKNIDVNVFPDKKELDIELENFIFQNANSERFAPEQIGRAVTTVSTPDAIKRVKHFMKFGQSILLPYFRKAIDTINPELKGIRLEVGRTWINVMYEGCKGLTHLHAFQPYCNFVGILYLEVPKDSAKLVIVNDDIIGKDESDYPESDKKYITPSPNILVIHKNDVNHAVTIHKSKDRRICVVFEVFYDEREWADIRKIKYDLTSHITKAVDTNVKNIINNFKKK